MKTRSELKPVTRGGVIGLGLGKFVFIGGGVALMLAANCFAGPQGAKVVAGQATIKQQGRTTIIRASDRSIIDYTSFDIKRNERVRFIQPGSSSTVLNRIKSERPTHIEGSLTANGRVFLVNPNGIFFAGTSVVRTDTIVAAAANISNQDFLRGNDRFTNVRGDVHNAGVIESASNAVMIGRHVGNSGTIMAGAENGVVAMVAGDGVTLTPRGGNITIHVADNPANPSEPPAIGKPGVENTGRISATRGRSLMLANDVYSLAARNTGSIKARSITVESKGRGDVKIAGELDASGSIGETGGRIDVSGQRVLVDQAVLDASGPRGGGQINIGGEAHGGGSLTRSEATTIGPDAVLKANATRNGEGGQVVVWSDGSMRFHGQASAKGGVVGGDGGFIETSGQNIDIRGGRADAGARAETGKGGTWLLDPFNVTIDNADGNPSGAPPMLDPFEPVADSNIDADDILNALATTDVEINTGSAGGSAGDITVDASGAINYTGMRDATLTLIAANDINVNAGIDSTNAQLNINLRANDALPVESNPTAGQVNIGNVAIDTNGGSMLMRGVDLSINAAATIDVGGGNVTMTANSRSATADGVTDQSIGIGVGAGDDGAGTGNFRVSQAELQTIISSGTVTINQSGRTEMSGTVHDSVTVGGGLDLSAQDYSLSIIGGDLTFGDITLNTGKTLALTAMDGHTITADGSTPDLLAPGGAIHFKADDLILGGVNLISTGVGTGTVRFEANTGRTLGLGTDNGVADLTLGRDELALTTTGGIEIVTTRDTSMGAPAGNADVILDAGGAMVADIPVDLGANVDLTINSGASIREERPSDNGGMGSALNDNTKIRLSGTGELTLQAELGIGDIATTNGELNIDVPSVSAQVTGTGDMALESSGAMNVVGASTADGDIRLRASDIVINTAGMGPAIAALGGDVVLEPVSAASTIGVGDDSVGAFKLTQAELLEVSTDGTLTIGRADGTGTIDVNRTGGLDLSTADYSLTLRASTASSGGDIIFNSTLTLGDSSSMDRRVSLLGSSISETLAAETAAVVVNGADSELLIDAGGDVSLEGSVDRLAGRLNTMGDTFEYTNINRDLRIDSIGGVDGVIGAAGSDITINGFRTAMMGSDTQITIAETVSTTGAGEVTISTNNDGSILDAVAGSDPAVSIGTTGEINLDTDGRIGGDMAATDPFKTTTGTINGADIAHLDARGGTGLNIANAGTGELRATLVSDTGDAALTHAGALMTDGTDWSAASFDVTSTGSFTSMAGDEITATGDVSLRSTMGAMTINDRVRSTMMGDVTLRSDAGMTINPVAMNPTVSAENGDIAIISDDNFVDINGEVRTITAGDIEISSEGIMNLDAGIETAMGDITLTGAGEIFVNSAVAANVGSVIVSADDLDITSGGSILATSMGGMGGEVTVGRSSSGIIDIGEDSGDTDPMGITVLDLTNADLARITADTLTIGDSVNTRQVRVRNVENPTMTSDPHANIDLVRLRAATGTGTITFSGARASKFNALDAVADAGIKLSAGITTFTGALSLDADGDGAAAPTQDPMMRTVIGIDIDKLDQLHVDGSQTLTSNAGSGNRDVTLRGRRSGMTVSPGILASNNLTVNSGRDIIISDNIDANGDVVLDADRSVAISGGGDIRLLNISANENVTLQGDMTIGSGGMAVLADADGMGAGAFSLLEDGMGRGTLTLSDSAARLRIVARDFHIDGTNARIVGGGGTVRIGRSTSGDVQVGDFVDADLTDDQFTISNAELEKIVAGNLVIGNFADTVAPSATNTNTRDILVRGVTEMASNGITDQVTLEAGRNIDFGGGASVFNGLTGRAVQNITVNSALSSQTGDLSLLADQTAVGSTDVPDNVGTLTINADVRTSGENFIGAGADFVLGGTINTTSTVMGVVAGDASITRSGGGTISVGNFSDAATRMTVSGAELRRITARNLTIGDNTRVSSVNVRDVVAADTSNISETTTLASNDSINFFAGTNTFGELVANADGRIAVDGDIVTTRGDLRLNGNNDNAATGDNQIEFTGNRVLNAAGDLVLSASNGSIINSSGDLTLRADDNITINDNVNVSGALAVLADDEPAGDGVGAVIISNGTAITSDTNDITIDGVSINLQDNAALVAALGKITLTANDDITIAGNITSSGKLSIHAGEGDINGTDTNADVIISGRRIATTGVHSDISIRGNTLNVSSSSSIESRRDVLIQRSTTGRIGLGAVSEDGLVLNDAELRRISADRDLIIGDGPDAGANDLRVTRLDVQGLTTASLTGIDGTFKIGARRNAGDGGVINFTGTSAQSFSNLEARARGRIQTSSALTVSRGGLLLDSSNGLIRLGGNLTNSTTGDTSKITLNGGTRLLADVTVTANDDITFDGTVSAPGRGDNRRMLVVNSPETITFAGDVTELFGLSINPLASGASSTPSRPNAVTRIGGNISTFADTRDEGGTGSNVRSGIRFRDRVVVTGTDVTIQDDGPNGIFFHGDVAAERSGVTNFTVAVRRDNRITSPDEIRDVRSIPIIAFGGDVGRMTIPPATSGGSPTVTTTRFKSINLNIINETTGNGHTNIPALPTIVFGSFGRTVGTTFNGDAFAATPLLQPSGRDNFPDIGFFATDSFNMGRNEKLTAFGDVIIDVNGAGGTATLSDISALRDLTVNASAIRMRARAAGAVYDTGTAGSGRTLLGLDNGLDFVAGRRINFSVRPTVIAPPGNAVVPRPTFASLSGRSGATTLGFDFFTFDTRRSTSPTNPDFSFFLQRTLGTTSTDPFTHVDMIASGTTDTNPATSIAGIIPRESRFNDVGRDTTISTAAQDKLRQIKVEPREQTTAEQLAGLSGWSLYNDDPSQDAGLALADSRDSSRITTTVNRLPGIYTAEVLDLYESIFRPRSVNDAGESVVGDSRPAIRAAFAKSLSDYRKSRPGVPITGPVDAEAWRRWVNENDSEARDYAERIDELLTALENLGLVGRELRNAVSGVLTQAKPQTVASLDTLERFVRYKPDPVVE